MAFDLNQTYIDIDNGKKCCMCWCDFAVPGPKRRCASCEESYQGLLVKMKQDYPAVVVAPTKKIKSAPPAKTKTKKATSTNSVLGDNTFVNSSKKACFYCEQPYNEHPREKLLHRTSDHVIPKAKNGSQLKHNTVYSHAQCNTRKADKTLEEFRAYVLDNNPPLPYDGTIIKNIDRLIERIKIINPKVLTDGYGEPAKPAATKHTISTGKYLTEKWICADNKTYVLHIGPTCSGKTYNAIERLKQSAGFGCYLAPLRLLAWEIAEKLNDAGIKCDLLTGEEKKYIEGAKIMSSTIEMLDYDKDFDVAVIDECFMIADKDRGKAWLRAILEVKAQEVHLILNEEVEQLLTEILTKAQKKFEVKKYQRLTRLQVDMSPYQIHAPKDKTAFIVFSRAKALMQKAQFEKRGYNVSILYGNLPPETKKEQMQKFISGENSICISTDVIGMGLNLPCEHVCFLEMEKFDGIQTRPLNSIEIKQIGGRAGRFGYSDVGYVSGITTNHLKAIMRGMSKNQIIDSAFFGIDYNIFTDIPLETAAGKLKFFRKMDCIPKALTGLIKKQDLTQMLEIAAYKGMDDFDIRLQWVLLNSPVKKINQEYFDRTITNLRSKLKMIWLPGFLNKFKAEEITDTTMLSYYEQHTAEIDMFTYFCNHGATNELVEPHDYNAVIAIKDEIITCINLFLVDKKKSSLKHCGNCSRELDISWPHRMCNSCFYGSREVRGRGF